LRAKRGSKKHGRYTGRKAHTDTGSKSFENLSMVVKDE
jgi:hypothetical protein